MKKLLLSLPLLLLFLMTTGCFDKDESGDSAVEKASEKVDNVMEDGAKKVEEAADAMSEKVEDK